MELSKHYLYRKGGGEVADRDRARTKGVLLHVLEGVLRLLHPFMPFISEEIWQHLPDHAALSGREREPLVISPWPEPCGELEFPGEALEMAVVQETIRAIRNLRSQVQLPPARRVPVVLRPSPEMKTVLEEEREHLIRLALAEPLTIDSQAAKPRQALTAVVNPQIEAYLPLGGVIDLEAEVARLQKELQQVEKEFERTDGKLSKPGFLQQAPPEVVEKEKSRHRELTSRREILKQHIGELTS